MISVRLFGAFAIRSADGRNLTPRGAKTQGMVALLMSAPDFTRTRVWLQDKLWSDRGPEQAAGSLRQAIYELRGCLGEEGGVLAANRRDVSLDPNSVMPMPASEPSGEFLEGLDVGDPEFEDWLTLQRSGSHPAPATPAFIGAPRRGCLAVAVMVAEGIATSDRFLVSFIADLFATTLEERALAEVRVVENGAGDADAFLSLSFHPDARILRGQIVATGNGRHIWSRSLQLDALGAEGLEQASIARFINAGIEAVVNAALHQGADAFAADADIHRGVRSIFTFHDAELDRAEALLARASETNAVALAWRVFLKMVQRVERGEPTDPAFVEEVEALMQAALRREPNHAMVLSAASHACLKVFDRPDDAVIFARRALDRSWSNPFALDVLGEALLYKGECEAAYAVARRAQFIGQATPMSHFFDMGLCLTCISTGRFDEALGLARQASALAPGFHSPLRYQVVLNAALGRTEEGARALHRLRMAEPGFDPLRFTQDRDYPVATFRNSALAKAQGIATLR